MPGSLPHPRDPEPGETGTMFSHVTIGTNDASISLPFYDAVLGTLGHSRFYGDVEKGFGGYGQMDGLQIWILPPFDGKPASAGNGIHVAFVAGTRQAVRDVHEAALSLGGADEGAPGLRLHYHPNYYGAYFRDPEGNKLQVVCHLPEEKAGT